MTLTEVDQEVTSVAPAPRFAWTPRGRLWAAGVLGFFLALVGVFAVNGLRPRPAVAVPHSYTVTFKVVGNATVDFAGIWTDGRDFTNGEVDPQATYTVHAPYTVVFTVRTDPGEKAQCQIFIDGKLAVEKPADDESATCVVDVR